MSDYTFFGLLFMGIGLGGFTISTIRLMRMHMQDAKGDTPFSNNLNKKVHTDQKGGQ